MRLTQDLPSGINVIRGYGAGEIRINDRRLRGSLLLTATEMLPEPSLSGIADLSAELAVRIIALEPELVLVGTGAKQCFPDAAFGAKLMRAGIGYEVMATGPACRTFNVLASEQRRVLAVLFV